MGEIFDTFLGMEATFAMAQPSLDQELDVELSTDELEDLPVTVVLYNDDVNAFSYVTFVLQRVLGCDRLKAESLMLTVHHEGKADLKTCPRSEAETMVLELAGYSLTAGIRS